MQLRKMTIMKKILFSMLLIASSNLIHAQDNVYPAKKQEGAIFIKNGTIHVGNGQVLTNTSVEVKDAIIRCYNSRCKWATCLSGVNIINVKLRFN
jgi:hypothetical protein